MVGLEQRQILSQQDRTLVGVDTIRQGLLLSQERPSILCCLLLEHILPHCANTAGRVGLPLTDSDKHTPVLMLDASQNLSSR